MKIVSTGRTISTEEFLEKKLRARRRRRIIFCSVFFILLILAVLLSRQEKLRIQEVLVTGAEATSVEEISSAALEALEGYYLWLVPKDNAVIYPGDVVEERLRKKFPRFNSINLSLSGLTLLNIAVSEREPFALYCTTEPESPCYFLDFEGFIFDFAPSFSEGVYFVYTSSELEGNPLGQPFLPASNFKSLSVFIAGLKELGVEALSLDMKPDQFIFALPVGARVIVSRGMELSRTLSDLKAFLASDTIRSDTGFLGKISELDLSVENKIRWKLK